MIIRLYQPTDRSTVRDISFKTSLEGRAADFIDAREALEDVLTSYFTDYVSQLSFVAEDNGNVVGYLQGTADIKMMRQTMNSKILPAVVRKVLLGTFWRKKNLVFFWHYFLGLCRGEFRRPCFDHEYPATFHLNIIDDYRHKGVGRALVERNLSFLQSKGIQGVQLGTMSEDAKNFFLKLGFHILFSSKRSYLKYILGADTPYYILGKKL